MTKYQKKQLIAVVAAVLLGVALCYVAFSQFGSDEIQLTKEESLRLMDLHVKAVLATGDRDEFVNVLCAKYGISLQTHDLDVANGKFLARSRNVRSKNDDDGTNAASDESGE